jgi:hypothetical protein
MDRFAESAQEREAALALRRDLGDPVKISENLRGLARCLWRLCRGEECERAAHEALQLMSGEPASAEAAWAHAHYAALIGDTHPRGHALSVARRGLQLAEAVDCAEAVAYSLNTIGTLEIGLNREGFAELERSIELARAHRLDDAVGRGYANLYQAAVDRCRFAEYGWCFTDGIAYARENDTATYTSCLHGSQATALVRTGRLAETVALVEATLRATVSPVNRLHLLIPLAAARLRQGHPDADALRERAWQLAQGIGERGWLLRMAVVEAEAVWLACRPGDPAPRGSSTSHAPGRTTTRGCSGSSWCGSTGWASRAPAPRRPRGPTRWSWRASTWPPRPGGVGRRARSTRRSSGRGRRGKGTWRPRSNWSRRRGRTGWRPGCAGRCAMRASVRSRAAPAPPPAPTRTGSRPARSRCSPCCGTVLTNAAIARRLYISERTVHRHVSAVLAKLGVSSRADVARVRSG